MPKFNPQDNRYRSREIINARRERRFTKLQEHEKQFLAIDDFVRNAVAPWASQSRISQIISTDFDDMANNTPRKTQKISFGQYNTPGYSPVIGHARFVYITPSNIKKKNHFDGENNVIHRGIAEQEFFNGQPATRIYVTVFSAAEVDAQGKTTFKDIHQDKDKIVRIYPGGAPILWVNGGDPLRALKWYEKYKAQDKNAKPLIRSFALPTHCFNTISKNAILEQDAGKTNKHERSFNVDRHYAPNQFGIRGNDLKMLQEKALQGSLITYTDNVHYAPPCSGEIKTVNSLRERLGVPLITIQGIWVDQENGSFVKKDKFGGNADELMNIYGIWMGNDHFIEGFLKNAPLLRRCTWLSETLSKKYGMLIPSSYFEQIKLGKTPAKIVEHMLIMNKNNKW